MKTLNAFIKAENAWRKIFNGTLLEIKTAKGRQYVADVIDSKLSPENLTCDGELDRATVSKNYRLLTMAAKQLKQLDPSINFYEVEV
jgi:hypothetical protein